MNVTSVNANTSAYTYKNTGSPSSSQVPTTLPVDPAEKPVTLPEEAPARPDAADTEDSSRQGKKGEVVQTATTLVSLTNPSLRNSFNVVVQTHEAMTGQQLSSASLDTKAVYNASVRVADGTNAYNYTRENAANTSTFQTSA